MSDTDHDEARHPMAVVTQRTGLTSHAIRAWERRYGVVDPGRSPGGHRLYSDREVERLRLLHQLTLGGRQIGQLAPLSDEELSDLLREDESAGATAPRAGKTGSEESFRQKLIDEAMAAVRDLDAETLDAVLRRAAIGLETMEYLEGMMSPLLELIGEAWASEEATPAHEHLASAVVGRVGGWLLENLEPEGDAPTLVVTTPAGDRHELGALAAAITAASAGWKALYLGPDLPARDIAAAAIASDARAVALSLVFPGAGASVADELVALRGALPPTVPIFAGGAAAELYGETLDEIEAVRIDSFTRLRLQLTGENA